MKILVVGGGTGGHVTPIRPVLLELRKLHPKVETFMIGHRGDGISSKMTNDPNLDKLYLIFAGKWRRYRNDNILQKIIDIPTHVYNLRDLFFIILGLMQSLRILRRERPDAIFIKGGYVGVPVGFAASWLKIPFITHDSDALPGLSNRIISSRAAVNAVGAPAKYYSYPEKKLRFTGIPIAASFKPVTARFQRLAKEDLGLKSDDKLVLVTGGSLGAQKINQVMVAIAGDLTKISRVVHIAGEKNIVAVQKTIGSLSSRSKGRYEVIDFTDRMSVYMSAADVVIARAGATMIAELGALGKACIFIPAPQLADQQKNTGMLELAGLKVAEEGEIVADPDKLLRMIAEIIDDDKLSLKLSRASVRFSKPDAASDIAKILSSLAQGRK